MASLHLGLRKEGGEGSAAGQLGQGRATSGAAPSQEGSLSLLVSSIPADTPNRWELAVDRHHPSGVKMRVQAFVWPGGGEDRGGVMFYCQGTRSSLRSLLGHAGMPTVVSSEC